MTNKKPVGMTQLFNQTGQSQQIFQLKDRIEELETEIVQLRSIALTAEDRAKLEEQIEELTAQLVETGGVHEIDIGLILPDSSQPRTIFPQWLIESRAKSLFDEGQQNPIIVIPENGLYKLFDGELRWRAAPLAKLKKLKAVYLLKNGLNKVEIFDRQLTTSLQSQNLHSLDLANGLIRLITYRYPELKKQAEEIPSVLNAAVQRLKRSQKIQEIETIRLKDTAIQQEWLEKIECLRVEEKLIFTVLLSKQLNPNSINTNVFPLLKLPLDLQAVVREQGLESSKAKELTKISASNLKISEDAALIIRSQVAEQAIREKLSLEQTRSLIRKTIKQYNTEQAPNDSAIAKTIKQIQNIKLQPGNRTQLENLRNTLQEKLHELESLLE